MTKYTVKLSEEDYQMLKDCHSKNPSIMKALEEAKKEEDAKKEEGKAPAAGQKTLPKTSAVK